MASTVSTSSLTTTQPVTTIDASQSKSYLARCVEDLSADKVSSFDRQSTLWTVAAGVTFVAFTALSVGAFVAAGFLLPAYLPVVALSALILAMPVANYVKNFLDYSEASRKEADCFREIQHNNQVLSQADPTQIQVDLIRRGINWFQIPGMQVSQPQKLSELNPIIARAQFLDSTIKDQLDLKESLTEDAKNFAIEDFAKHRSTIYDLRNAALHSEHRAFEAKIEAAFVNAVLRKGDFKGAIEDVGTLSDVTFNERVLGNAVNDPTGINDFFSFKNRSIAPITCQDIARLSVSELGQRFVAAMA